MWERGAKIGEIGNRIFELILHTSLHTSYFILQVMGGAIVFRFVMKKGQGGDASPIEYIFS